MSRYVRPVRAGAHYGLRDWLAQRLTAVALLLFVIVVLVRLALQGGLSYNTWAGVFTPVPIKYLSVLAFGSLAYHAWVGVRDIWMDYIKPVGIRLTLHVLTIVWLAYCLVWAVQILWSI